MKSSDDRLLLLIAVFKFLKAALLIALGVGAFKLLQHLLSNDVRRLPEGGAQYGVICTEQGGRVRVNVSPCASIEASVTPTAFGCSAEGGCAGVAGDGDASARVLALVHAHAGT